jgi:hypothetical protein
VIENWLPVPGWEGFYEVSDQGRVRGVARSVPGRPGVLINKRERLLTPNLDCDGYPRVWLCRNGGRLERRIHVLVALAFVGPRPDGFEVCHADGDKTRNTPDNLRWGTRSENTYDKVRHGAHPQARKTHCPQGHPYDETNTYLIRTGGRACRTCTKQRKRARRLERNAA